MQSTKQYLNLFKYVCFICHFVNDFVLSSNTLVFHFGSTWAYTPVFLPRDMSKYPIKKIEVNIFIKTNLSQYSFVIFQCSIDR